MIETPNPDTARARWVTDPRGDDFGDSALWEALLDRAYELHGDQPDGLFAALHGFRCCGATLIVDRAGVRLSAGELGGEFPTLHQRYLRPHSSDLRRLLRELCASRRSRARRAQLSLPGTQ